MKANKKSFIDQTGYSDEIAKNGSSQLEANLCSIFAMKSAFKAETEVNKQMVA